MQCQVKLFRFLSRYGVKLQCSLQGFYVKQSGALLQRGRKKMPLEYLATKKKNKKTDSQLDFSLNFLCLVQHKEPQQHHPATTMLHNKDAMLFLCYLSFYSQAQLCVHLPMKCIEVQRLLCEKKKKKVKALAMALFCIKNKGQKVQADENVQLEKFRGKKA